MNLLSPFKLNVMIEKKFNLRIFSMTWKYHLVFELSFFSCTPIFLTQYTSSITVQTSHKYVLMVLLIGPY